MLTVIFWALDIQEAQKAINEMNGAWLGSRAIRTNWATRKPPAPVERVKQRQPQKLNYDEVYAQASETNSTVYIGGIHEGLCGWYSWKT